MNVYSYTSSEAEPLLLSMIKRGGTAVIVVDKQYRMLMHTPSFDLPRFILPWPLSLIQPHGCHFFVYRAYESKSVRGMWTADINEKNLIFKHYFVKRSEHRLAIKHFLEGSKPNDIVSISDGV